MSVSKTSGLLAIAQRLREVDENFSVGQIALLFLVADRGSILMGELAQQIQINPATVSRVVSKMRKGPAHVPSYKGGKIFKTEEDSFDPRKLRVSLTAYGQTFVKELTDLIP